MIKIFNQGEKYLKEAVYNVKGINEPLLAGADFITIKGKEGTIQEIELVKDCEKIETPRTESFFKEVSAFLESSLHPYMIFSERMPPSPTIEGETPYWYSTQQPIVGLGLDQPVYTNRYYPKTKPGEGDTYAWAYSLHLKEESARERAKQYTPGNDYYPHDIIVQMKAVHSFVSKQTLEAMSSTNGGLIWVYSRYPGGDKGRK